MSQPKVLEEEGQIVEGYPNYYYLTVHTRLFPHIVFKGMLVGGIEGLQETAEEPLLRTFPLRFRAFSSIPELYGFQGTELLQKYLDEMAEGRL